MIDARDRSRGNAKGNAEGKTRPRYTLGRLQVVDELHSIDRSMYWPIGQGLGSMAALILIAGREFTLDSGERHTHPPPQQVHPRDLNGLSIEFPRRRGTVA